MSTKFKIGEFVAVRNNIMINTDSMGIVFDMSYESIDNPCYYIIWLKSKQIITRKTFPWFGYELKPYTGRSK